MYDSNSEVLKMMVLRGPKVVENPQQGFNGYLLRCKAIPEEDCTQSYIIYEPDNPEAVNMHLPASYKARRKLRGEWYHHTGEANYAQFVLELARESEYDALSMAFPNTPEAMQELADTVIRFCKGYLPSYDVFAVAVHVDQMTLHEDGAVTIRAPHIHILMKSMAKIRTLQEMRLLGE